MRRRLQESGDSLQAATKQNKSLQTLVIQKDQMIEYLRRKLDQLAQQTQPPNTPPSPLSASAPLSLSTIPQVAEQPAYGPSENAPRRHTRFKEGSQVREWFVCASL